MSRPLRCQAGLLAMLSALLVGCVAATPAPMSEVGTGPGTSRQVSECNFSIEFAPESAALDAAALRAIRLIAVRAHVSGRVAIHSGIAPGEPGALAIARYDAIRAALSGAGLPPAAVTRLVLSHSMPSDPPRANAHVCPPWDSPLRQRRAEPADPQRLIEYRIGGTTMRIPLALLGPSLWNDAPLEPPMNPPTLYLSRDGGAEADIPAIRQATDGPNNDDGRRRLIIATVRPWFWTPELDPPSYRLPPSGSTEPSPRARFSFTVSRSRSPPGPANYIANFAWRDGGRTVAEGDCTRFDTIARTDASAFVTDRQVQCRVHMVRLTPTVGANMLISIDNLDEVPVIVERARRALLRYVVPPATN